MYWNSGISTGLQGKGPLKGYTSQDVKDLYKTVWEIKQRCVLDMAADRGIYIDQSQSLMLGRHPPPSHPFGGVGVIARYERSISGIATRNKRTLRTGLLAVGTRHNVCY